MMNQERRAWGWGVLLCVAALAAPAAAGPDVLFVDGFAGTPLGSFPESLRLTGGDQRGLQSPLLAAFRDYHVVANLEVLRHLRQHTKATARRVLGPDHPFPIAGNLAGVYTEPRWFEFAQVFDFLNNEYGFQEGDPDDDDLVNLYAIANYLQIPVVNLSNHINNLRWEQQENPVFYAMMVAQSYAMGHYLTVPYALYDGSFKHRWFGRVETHAPIYHFVHDIKSLLNGYEALAWEAVIAPQATHNLPNDEVLGTMLTAALAAHRPTALFFSGAHLPPLAPDRFAGCRRVRLLGKLEDCAEADRALIVQLTQRRDDHARFDVEAAGRVWLLPRGSTQSSEAPLVLHLLNREARFANGVTTLAPLTDVQVLVHESVIAGRPVRGARRYRPGSPPAFVPMRRDGDRYVFSVDRIDSWTVLAIDAGDQRQNPGLQAMRFDRPRAVPQGDVILMRPAHRYDKPDYIVPWLQDDQGRIDETLVLDAYDVDRISWEYQVFPGFRERGIAYHGTVNLGMAPVGPERPLTWPGWARMPDGTAMMGRADFTPPQYVCDPSSPAYRTYTANKIDAWVAEGVDGITWDDVPWAVGRIWPQGGNFSAVFLRGFQDWLGGRDLPASVTGCARLDETDLTERLEQERRHASPFQLAQVHGKTALVLPLIDPERADPIYWLSTPRLSCTTRRVRIRTEVFLSGTGDNAVLGLYVKDGIGGSMAISSFVNRKSVTVISRGESVTVAPYRTDCWQEVEIVVDFATETARFGVEGVLSEPLAFRHAGSVKADDFAFFLLKRPNTNDAAVATLVVEALPD